MAGGFAFLDEEKVAPKPEAPGGGFVFLDEGQGGEALPYAEFAPAEPEKPSILRRGLEAVGLASPEQLTPTERARANVELGAAQEGVPLEEYREGPQALEQFAQGALSEATLGLAPRIYEAATGEAPGFEPSGTAQEIARGAGSLAGFVAGAPGAIAKGTTKLGTRLIGEHNIAALNKYWMGRIPVQMGLQAAGLASAFGAASLGQALENSNVSGALDDIWANTKEGAKVGAVFGGAVGAFPKQRIMRIATVLTAIEAERYARNPEAGLPALDDRALAQKVFDYGLEVYFAWHGMGDKVLDKLETRTTRLLTEGTGGPITDPKRLLMDAKVDAAKTLPLPRPSRMGPETEKGFAFLDIRAPGEVPAGVEAAPARSAEFEMMGPSMPTQLRKAPEPAPMTEAQRRAAIFQGKELFPGEEGPPVQPVTPRERPLTGIRPAVPRVPPEPRGAEAATGFTVLPEPPPVPQAPEPVSGRITELAGGAVRGIPKPEQPRLTQLAQEAITLPPPLHKRPLRHRVAHMLTSEEGALRIFEKNRPVDVDDPMITRSIVEGKSLSAQLIDKWKERAKKQGVSEEGILGAVLRFREYNKIKEAGNFIILPDLQISDKDVVFREGVLNTPGIAGERRKRLDKYYEGVQQGERSVETGALLPGGEERTGILPGIRGKTPRVFLNVPITQTQLGTERPLDFNYPLVVTGNPHVLNFRRPHPSWDASIVAVRVKPVYRGSPQAIKATVDAIQYAKEIGAKVLITTFRAKQPWVLARMTDIVPTDPSHPEFKYYWKPNPNPRPQHKSKWPDWTPYVPQARRVAEAFQKAGWRTQKDLYGEGGTWWWPESKELDPRVIKAIGEDTPVEYCDLLHKGCPACRNCQKLTYPEAAGAPIVGVTDEPFCEHGCPQCFVRLGQSGVNGRKGISVGVNLKQAGYGEADLGDIYPKTINIIQKVARPVSAEGRVDYISRFMDKTPNEQMDMMMSLYVDGKITADELITAQTEIAKNAALLKAKEKEQAANAKAFQQWFEAEKETKREQSGIGKIKSKLTSESGSVKLDLLVPFVDKEPKWAAFGREKRKEFYDPDAIKQKGKYQLWDFDNNVWETFGSKTEEAAFRERNPYLVLGEHAAGPERTWYRYGKPPPNNRSINQAENRGEYGVSVNATPEGSSPFFAERDIYSGPGRQVGWGSDGEPLIIPSGKWKKVMPPGAGKIKDQVTEPVPEQPATEELGTPKETIKAYKLFRTKKKTPGELYPLFIKKDQPVPQGRWLPAENVPTAGFAKRPGWHAGAYPQAPHLMKKSGELAADRVWTEVELPADTEWQPIADKSKTKDIRDRVPEGGHYRFKRSAKQGREWIIGGALKVNKVLSQEEVRSINRKLTSESGAINLDLLLPSELKKVAKEVVGRIAEKRDDVFAHYLRWTTGRTDPGIKVTLEKTHGPQVGHLLRNMESILSQTKEGRTIYEAARTFKKQTPKKMLEWQARYREAVRGLTAAEKQQTLNLLDTTEKIAGTDPAARAGAKVRALLQDVRQYLVDNGHKVGYIEGYLPHIFQGRFWVKEDGGFGRKVDSFGDALKIADEIASKTGKRVTVMQDTFIPSDDATMLSQKAYWRLIKNLRDGVGDAVEVMEPITSADARAMLDGVAKPKPRPRFFGNMKSRIVNNPNYIKDLDQIMDLFFYGASRKVHQDRFWKEVQGNLEAMPQGDADLRKFTEDVFMPQVLAHPSRLETGIARAINDARFLPWKGMTGQDIRRIIHNVNLPQYVMDLGFSASSAVANATQFWINAYPIVGQGAAWRGYKKGLDTFRDQRLFDEADRMGITNAVSSITGEILLPKDILKQVRDNIKNVKTWQDGVRVALETTLVPFSMVEMMNRFATYWAGKDFALRQINKGRRAVGLAKKVSPETSSLMDLARRVDAREASAEEFARQFGYELNDKTQFRVGRENLPELLNKTGLRLVSPYKSFLLNQLRYTAETLGPKGVVTDPKKALRFSAASIALGGLRGNPILWGAFLGISALYKALWGEDLAYELQRRRLGSANFLLRGVAGELGADISGSVAVILPERAEDILGRFGKIFLNLGKLAFGQGDVFTRRQVGRLLQPAQVQRVLDAISIVEHGEYRTPITQTPVAVERPWVAAVQRALGAMPRDVAQTFDEENAIRAKERKYKRLSADLTERWATAVRDNDEAGMEKVMQRVAEEMEDAQAAYAKAAESGNANRILEAGTDVFFWVEWARNQTKFKNALERKIIPRQQKNVMDAPKYMRPEAAAQ